MKVFLAVLKWCAIGLVGLVVLAWAILGDHEIYPHLGLAALIGYMWFSLHERNAAAKKAADTRLYDIDRRLQDIQTGLDEIQQTGWKTVNLIEDGQGGKQ